MSGQGRHSLYLLGRACLDITFASLLHTHGSNDQSKSRETTPRKTIYIHGRSELLPISFSAAQAIVETCFGVSIFIAHEPDRRKSARHGRKYHLGESQIHSSTVFPIARLVV